jgi:peptidoglycan hydrolase CwlO-like protein
MLQMAHPSMQAALEWQTLCKDHEEAQKQFDEINAVCSQKWALIAAGTSKENPTAAEEADYDKAMEKLKNIRRKMDEFMKSHS